MQLDHLIQAPFHTTLMGAMRGALDYYGIEVSDAALYGMSGHAFMLNIHKQICPSGPYCFHRQGIDSLLENVGLRVESLGYFDAGSGAAERAAVETRIRESLGAGVPCMFMNLENQLITGWDETGFLVAQPWACSEFTAGHLTPGHLTFGAWDELGQEVHMTHCILHRAEPKDVRASVKASLCYAVDLWRNPSLHTQRDYGVGPDGYQNWIAAVKQGHGTGHGNWWNGTVWSECRGRAAEYLREVADLLPPEAHADEVADGYAEVADLLEQCTGKELEVDTRAALLAAARDREQGCIERLEKALETMG